MGFPTRVTTIRQVGICRDADVVVNGDVATDRRANVIRQDVLAASRSAVDTCVDGTEEHRIQRHRRTGREGKANEVFVEFSRRRIIGREPAGW